LPLALVAVAARAPAVLRLADAPLGLGDAVPIPEAAAGVASLLGLGASLGGRGLRGRGWRRGPGPRRSRGRRRRNDGGCRRGRSRSGRGGGSGGRSLGCRAAARLAAEGQRDGDCEREGSGARHHGGIMPYFAPRRRGRRPAPSNTTDHTRAHAPSKWGSFDKFDMARKPGYL
jgi:hypothetical protein